MENFKTFGECSYNIFKQLLSNQVDNIHKRHLAKILRYLEDNGVDDSVVAFVKKEIGFYGNDIRYLILGLRGEEDGK
jgi:hypothetical protein